MPITLRISLFTDDVSLPHSRIQYLLQVGREPHSLPVMTHLTPLVFSSQSARHRQESQVYQDRIFPHPGAHLLWSLCLDDLELSHQRQAQASGRARRFPLPLVHPRSHIYGGCRSQTRTHRFDLDRSGLCRVRSILCHSSLARMGRVQLPRGECSGYSLAMTRSVLMAAWYNCSLTSTLLWDSRSSLEDSVVLPDLLFI